MWVCGVIGMIEFFRLHSDLALRLQQNSYNGTLVLIAGVCFLYIVITILTIVIARKSGLNTCILGSILGVQFIVGVVGVIRLISAGIKRKMALRAKRRAKLMAEKVSVKALDEDEEIEF